MEPSVSVLAEASKATLSGPGPCCGVAVKLAVGFLLSRWRMTPGLQADKLAAAGRAIPIRKAIRTCMNWPSDTVDLQMQHSSPPGSAKKNTRILSEGWLVTQ